MDSPLRALETKGLKGGYKGAAYGAIRAVDGFRLSSLEILIEQL